MHLRELAERLGCRLEGDGALEIRGVAGLEQAGEGDLSFFANPRYAPALRRTRASAVIIGESAPPAPCAMLRTKASVPRVRKRVSIFAPQRLRRRESPRSARLRPMRRSAAMCRSGRSRRWDVARASAIARSFIPTCSSVTARSSGTTASFTRTRRFASASSLGNRVIVQNGAVIGADGYGFVKRPDGTHQKIPQTAIVVIEDDVEIGANTTIDRPAVGETRIQAGAKIDNLVQIGHGVNVGRNTLLAAQVGIAGSTTIGDDVTLAGQVGVAGHVTVGKGASAVGQSGITNSVPDGTFVSGYPAIENKEWLKSSVIFKKLPELRKKIADLEQRILELEAVIARGSARL